MKRALLILVLIFNILFVSAALMPISVAGAEMLPLPKLTFVFYYASVELGQWATIRVNGTNNGGSAAHQTMQISFPDNLSISDIQILSSDLSSHPELYPSGSTLGKNYGNGTVTAIYPVVEGDDRPWNGGENHYLEVRVRPEKTGAFTFYVKTVAADSNWKVQAYDPGSGTRDQQNEYVNVYSFTVVPVTQTATTITSIMTSTPSTTTHGLVTSTVKIPTPTIPLSPVTTIIIIAILLLLLLTPAAATTATSKRTAITKAAPNIM